MWLGLRPRNSSADGGAPHARSYDNVALGAFMLHAEAAPESFSGQALAQHFTTGVLAYVQQSGHLTRGALPSSPTPNLVVRVS